MQKCYKNIKFVSSSRFAKKVIIKNTIDMKMQNQVKSLYQAPKVEFIELYSEGVLCASEEKELEDLFEHMGKWGN